LFSIHFISIIFLIIESSFVSIQNDVFHTQSNEVISLVNCYLSKLTQNNILVKQKKTFFNWLCTNEHNKYGYEGVKKITKKE